MESEIRGEFQCARARAPCSESHFRAAEEALLELNARQEGGREEDRGAGIELEDELDESRTFFPLFATSE